MRDSGPERMTCRKQPHLAATGFLGENLEDCAEDDSRLHELRGTVQVFVDVTRQL
jgi:hypothetical protein